MPGKANLSGRRSFANW